jgi:hypothetical protein
MVAHPLGDLGHARGLGEAERRRGEEEQTLFAHATFPFPQRCQIASAAFFGPFHWRMTSPLWSVHPYVSADPLSESPKNCKDLYARTEGPRLSREPAAGSPSYTRSCSVRGPWTLGRRVHIRIRPALFLSTDLHCRCRSFSDTLRNGMQTICKQRWETRARPKAASPQRIEMQGIIWRAWRDSNSRPAA